MGGQKACKKNSIYFVPNCHNSYDKINLIPFVRPLSSHHLASLRCVSSSSMSSSLLEMAASSAFLARICSSARVEARSRLLTSVASLGRAMVTVHPQCDH